MEFSHRVLVADDQVGAIGWLIDFLEFRGYETDLVTNEKDARQRLHAVQSEELAFALAILDVMLPTRPIEEEGDFGADFFESSMNTGVRLCQYARCELGLTEDDLAIVCLSARQDEEVQRALKDLGVRLFKRSNEEIRDFLLEKLPRLV